MSEEIVLPDFAGKTVVVYVANAPGGVESGIMLEYPEFKKFNDRLFLTGRMPQVDGYWATNLSGGIAWDSVVHYLVCNTSEELKARLSEKSGLLRRFFPRAGD